MNSNYLVYASLPLVASIVYSQINASRRGRNGAHIPASYGLGYSRREEDAASQTMNQARIALLKVKDVARAKIKAMREMQPLVKRKAGEARKVFTMY